MSIEKIKRFEDLKAQVNKVFQARNEVISSQRPLALNSVLKEMSDYLKEKEFIIGEVGTPSKGFSASYGEKHLVVSAPDEEVISYYDYQIAIKCGEKKATVNLTLNRGGSVQNLVSGDFDKQLYDFETRYLPSVIALDIRDLDGNYKLDFYAPNLKNTVRVANGKEAIDKFFEFLVS